MRLILALLLVLPAARPEGAEIKLAKIFGDHMVLRRDIDVPIWGTAAPGQKVTVSLADRQKEGLPASPFRTDP